MADKNAVLDQLDTLTLGQVVEGLDSGVITVEELVRAHLDRIRQWNPLVHAVIEINPKADVIAAELDRELLAGRRRGPLHGVPILVKDNIVSDELEATAGSLALLGAKPVRENAAVTKLRAAGAVVLGTSNVSEWANFRSTTGEDNGWSPRGGQTFGAYADRMDPSGSSSGSAVAVDLGLCVLALGTETCGSIIFPADKNNVVGIKPTVGLVSRNAVIPIADSQDTVGPMARSVYDAACMLTVIAGRDEDDERSASCPAVLPDYAARAVGASVAGLRLGVPRNALDDVPDFAHQAFDATTRRLRELGADIVDVELPCASRYRELDAAGEIFDSLTPEFNQGLAHYFSRLATNPNKISTMQDLIEFTRNQPAEEYPQRDMHWFERSVGLDWHSPEHLQGVHDSALFAGDEGINGTMDANTLDAFIAPSLADIPNYVAARGGFPVVSVPLDYRPEGTPVTWNATGRLVTSAPHIPLGFSVIGRRFSEATLISIAAVVEQITETRGHASSHRFLNLESGL